MSNIILTSKVQISKNVHMLTARVPKWNGSLRWKNGIATVAYTTIASTSNIIANMMDLRPLEMPIWGKEFTKKMFIKRLQLCNHDTEESKNVNLINIPCTTTSISIYTYQKYIELWYVLKRQKEYYEQP